MRGGPKTLGCQTQVAGVGQDLRGEVIVAAEAGPDARPVERKV